MMALDDLRVGGPRRSTCPSVPFGSVKQRKFDWFWFMVERGFVERFKNE